MPQPALSRSIRTVVVLSLVVLTGFTGAVFSDHHSAGAPTRGGAPLALDLPSALFSSGAAGCPIAGSSPRSAVFGLNIPAVGSGVYATGDLATMTNNSGVNTTVTVPNAALSSNQYVLLGVGDPVNATAVVAVGVAETAVPILGTVAVPVAYLPNGTEVYSTSISGPFLTKGAKYTFAAQHARGNWWSLSFNGSPIVGGASWENGTYDLGTPTAVGVACGMGVRTAPAFVAALYGNGTSPPTLPTTFVPRAVGVAAGGASSASYLPISANALPQLNASLGTLYVQGSVQNTSLPTGALYVGSSASLGYPGANASVWGSYIVRSLGSASIAPLSTGVAFGGAQAFSVNVTDGNGGPLPEAMITWQLVPASLGTLNSTSGTSVTFTAGTSSGTGTLWANATYNCSIRSAAANVTVSAGGGPAILSFAAEPPAVVVGEGTNFSTVNGSWARPLSYTYVGLPSACASANLSRLACVPDTVGNYTVTVFVNDSSGASSDATTTLTVEPVLQISSFTATPNPATVGASIELVVKATGGVLPLSYVFSGLPPGCPNGLGSATFTCQPLSAASGTFHVHASVNDSAGHSTGADLTLVLTPSTTVPQISSFAAEPNPVAVGSETILSVQASGGVGPLGYAYVGLPAGCSSANTSSLTCAPNATGAYNVTVTVTDSRGRSVSQSLNLQVDAGSSRGAGSTSIPGEALIIGVAAAAVIALLAIWTLRRRRRPAHPVGTTAESPRTGT